MMKRDRQVTLSGGPPSPKKDVAVPLNETEAERRRRRSMERYRHERELAAWKRSK
ncbi:hypothetical protein [Mesorhizobium sp. M7A.F.Ca.US.011.01.1.1]|uniref:hypothetical protein n=1 Tax=Mesorhizobium sp. M7A.F.Ca.US.011.01.1.1 TaxID=2496741 RepID=UPI0013E2A291|nr:hypothetical protein [Mesorhizobium sp. M7A.F.Ca.US.011.01.1.1]